MRSSPDPNGLCFGHLQSANDFCPCSSLHPIPPREAMKECRRVWAFLSWWEWGRKQGPTGVKIKSFCFQNAALPFYTIASKFPLSRRQSWACHQSLCGLSGQVLGSWVKAETQIASQSKDGGARVWSKTSFYFLFQGSRWEQRAQRNGFNCRDGNPSSSFYHHISFLICFNFILQDEEEQKWTVTLRIRNDTYVLYN